MNPIFLLLGGGLAVYLLTRPKGEAPTASGGEAGAAAPPQGAGASAPLPTTVTGWIDRVKANAAAAVAGYRPAAASAASPQPPPASAGAAPPQTPPVPARAVAAPAALVSAPSAPTAPAPPIHATPSTVMGWIEKAKTDAQTAVAAQAAAVAQAAAAARIDLNVPALTLDPLQSRAPKLAPPLPGRWVWPVPRWQGRLPVISDGYGSPRPGTFHAGVDIMFARLPTDTFRPGTPNGSKHYVMPDAWLAIAASDGVVWSAGRTQRGYAVVLDHSPRVATFYTHLETLFIPEVHPPAKGTPREHMLHVKAGQPLGVIGGDPLDHEHLKHLHFELWLGGPADAVDPKSLMSVWPSLTTADVAPFLVGPRNAKRKPKGERPEFVSVSGYDVDPYERRWPGTALHEHNHQD